MIISHAYTELKRRAKEGCLEAMLDLVDCYGTGKHCIKEDQGQYIKKMLEVLERIDEIRASKFSSAQVFYEIMYTYLEQRNDVMGEYYHHHLMWEIALDYPSGDLEPYFEEFQVREIAEYLDINVENTLSQIKAWQKRYDPETYKTISVNHFFTN